jgi:hypothetical protein
MRLVVSGVGFNFFNQCKVKGYEKEGSRTNLHQPDQQGW